MRKYLILMLLALIAGACSDKNNDEPLPVPEAKIQFDVEKIAVPENLKVYYQSPDPHCGVPKYYHIYLDYTANELLLKCNNAESIYLHNVMYAIGDKYFNGSINQGRVDIPDFGVSIIMEDEKTIRLNLDPYDPTSAVAEEWESVRISLTVADKANPTTIKETLTINRSLNRDVNGEKFGSSTKKS